MIALISVLVVALLGLVGATAYVSLGKDDLVTAAGAQPAAITQVATDTRGQPAPTIAQTEIVVAPSSGSSSGSSGPPRSPGLVDGNLSSTWKGTSSASDPFIRNMHNVYIHYRNSTGRGSGTVTAYSPITGLTYDMWCRASGNSIRCTDGRNTVVYIG